MGWRSVYIRSISQINRVESILVLKPHKMHHGKIHLPITLGLVFIGLTEVRSMWPGNLARQSTQRSNWSVYCTAVLGGTDGVQF